MSKNSLRGIIYEGYVQNNNPITNCRIEENVGEGLKCGKNSVMKIENSIIERNTAINGGGLLCSSTSKLWVSDCVIAHNSATQNGGGIKAASLKFGVVNIRHCTITQNTAGKAGGGIYVFTHTSSFNLTNSIVWGNTSDRIYAEVLAGGVGITIKSCDIKDGLDGISRDPDEEHFIYQDNIDADPLFVDADLGDYRLKANSPAAGMGVSKQAFQTGPFAVSQHGKRLVKWADLKRK